MNIKDIKFKQGFDSRKKGEILNEGLHVLSESNRLRVAMKEFSENKDSTFQDSMNLVVSYEEFLILETSTLDFCSSVGVGTSGAIRRRITCFGACLNKVKSLLKPNVDAFIPLEEKEFQEVYQYLKEAVGQLACYISYQFGLREISSLDDSSEIEEVTDAVDFWLRDKKKGLDTLRDLATYTNELVIECHPYMGVFEKYDNLLEPFMDLVGEVIYDCADITVKTVLDVIEGRLDVDEFLRDLEEKECQVQDACL